MQLTSISEERDRLRHMVNELKREKNAQGGPEIMNGTVVEVCGFNALLYLVIFIFPTDGLGFCFARKGV